MAKESSLLPKMEVLIIVIIFIGIIVWIFDKCSDTKKTYNEQLHGNPDAVDELLSRRNEGLALPPVDSLPAPAADAGPAQTNVNAEAYPPLYVIIEGLNLRDQPNLQGKVLTRLKLYEKVAFLGEVTDSTEQINLGSMTADEPWVKVQGRGHVGWVYGAGVEYYKKKLEGAQ